MLTEPMCTADHGAALSQHQQRDTHLPPPSEHPTRLNTEGGQLNTNSSMQETTSKKKVPEHLDFLASSSDNKQHERSINLHKL